VNKQRRRTGARLSATPRRMTCHCKPMLVPHAEAPSCL
jgi:hypothetical protein